MEYKDFSAADFICDKFFQDWIIQPNQETDTFWNNWILQHQEKKEIVEEAKNILSTINFKEHLPTEEQVR
ncbi:MAG: hypothetical protein JWM28_3963, partial [Chitinophagaceae bacterium]|nr:hypothetical protein [Chitinophagaceae bacterium]